MTPAKIKQGQPRIEEPFMLTAMASLLGGTLWMWVRHRQFLQYFYSSEFLALTHVITLGCVTSLMMGVILRLAPMSLRVNPRSARLARVQFGPFVTGRAREWEVVPLVLLVAISVTGVLLAFEIPAPENPLRMRVQLVRSSPFRFGFGKSVSSAISARRRCRG